MTQAWPTDRETLERESQVSFFRSGGPGGQHRNKVETAVRIVHPPSGVTVTATERRSQFENRELAWERLIEKLKAKNFRPKKRKPTKKPRSADRKRLETKKRRGQTKRDRKLED
ncbi:MAG TPA: peptide chain release factor-like protein [Planctomycetota bacterium]|nr:peptide chain release factor-like protein [Planctomycetota bacterium]HJM40228.1 peptide chain release factor-like protein [Planctomycetota bacterium]